MKYIIYNAANIIHLLFFYLSQFSENYNKTLKLLQKLDIKANAFISDTDNN